MNLNELLLEEAKRKKIDGYIPELLVIAENKFFAAEALALMMYTESTMDPKHEGFYNGELICGGLFAFHRDVVSSDGFTVRQVIDNGAEFQFNLKKKYSYKMGIFNCFWCTMADNYLPILRKEIIAKNWNFILSPAYFPYSTSGCTLFEYLTWLCFIPSITAAQLTSDYSLNSFRSNIYLFHDHSAILSKKKMNEELNEALLHVIQSLPHEVNNLLTWKSMFLFVRSSLNRSEYKRYSLVEEASTLTGFRQDKKTDPLTKGNSVFLLSPFSKKANTKRKEGRSSKANHLSSLSRATNNQLTINERSTAERILKEIKFKN